MIDIKNFFSINMEMLNQQERELANALNIIQQIKQMLSSQGGGFFPVKKRRGRPPLRPAVPGLMAPVLTPFLPKRKPGRPKGFSPKKPAPAPVTAKPASVKPAPPKPKPAKPAKPAQEKTTAVKSKAHVPAGKRPPRKGSWLEKIFKYIETNGPTASGKIIEHLFKNQKEVKKIVEFRKLIFPVFTRAYRDKFLVNKKGIVHFTHP
jgi:hypothetical protein